MRDYIRYYILNTSFHGFRYIAERNRHWSERLFWGICCTLSWVASILLMRASWDDFQNNAISFVVETSYLDWDTHFPSIYVCETDNQDKLAEVTDKIYGDPHDYNLDEVVKELAFFRGLSFYTLHLCGADVANKPPQCVSNNFSVFSNQIRSTCKEIFKRCLWNEQEFNCCTYFVPVDTELGPCYGINSKQTRQKRSPRFEMTSNKNSAPGTFRMELYGQVNVYTIGELEVPSLTTLQTDVLQVTPHVQYHRYIAIKEIENQPEVAYTPYILYWYMPHCPSFPVHYLFTDERRRNNMSVHDVSVKQRKCRFMDESDLNVYRHYSYTACCVQCRKDAQIELCNCTHHFMPGTPFDLQCDINGLKCLNDNYNKLAVLKAEWSSRAGLVCDCLPSCTEIELSIIKDLKSGVATEHAVVELSLDRLPSEKFKRNVVRDKLDLIVSMGGAAALFLGASILSFVEIAYYFTVRPVSNSLTESRFENVQK